MKQEQYTITSASATGTRAVIKSITRTVTAGHPRQNQSANSNVVTLPEHGKEDEEDPQRTEGSDSDVVTIPYPCCPKEKAVVFPGAHGCASYKCPNCGKYAVFDYDSLTSKPGNVCRGASKRSRAVAK